MSWHCCQSPGATIASREGDCTPLQAYVLGIVVADCSGCKCIDATTQAQVLQAQGRALVDGAERIETEQQVAVAQVLFSQHHLQGFSPVLSNT